MSHHVAETTSITLMPITRRLLATGAVLLAACATDTPTIPRDGDLAVTISAIEEGATVFDPATPFVRARVTIRNVSAGTVSIVPCSGSLEARAPDSRTWTNIGLATVGLCPADRIVLTPGNAADVGAAGAAGELRALAGAGRSEMIVRASFLAVSGAVTRAVESNEFTLSRR